LWIFLEVISSSSASGYQAATIDEAVLKLNSIDVEERGLAVMMLRKPNACADVRQQASGSIPAREQPRNRNVQ